MEKKWKNRKNGEMESKYKINFRKKNFWKNNILN